VKVHEGAVYVQERDTSGVPVQPDGVAVATVRVCIPFD